VIVICRHLFKAGKQKLGNSLYEDICITGELKID